MTYGQFTTKSRAVEEKSEKPAYHLRYAGHFLLSCLTIYSNIPLPSAGYLILTEINPERTASEPHGVRA